MTINSQQMTEAQNWIQNSGWGSYDPGGGFKLTGGFSGDVLAGASITGAAQSMGYSDADLSQILRGAYSADQIGAFKQAQDPLVDTYQSVFEHDKAGASQPSPAAPQGGGNLGFGGGSSGASSTSGPNPYLSQMADDIGRRSNLALGQGLQGIRSNSIGVGGLGGSRQGVAEGAAISGAADNLQGNLANLYGTDNNNMQNRNLQRYGMDQSTATQRYGIDQNTATQQMGIGTNAYLTNQGQMQNFYTQNRSLDQSGMQLGANLFNQGNAGYMGQGQGVYGIGATQQQAPWQVIGNTSGNVSPYTGYGQTTTGSGSSGGGATGALGGALAGAQIGKNLGFGSGGYGSDPYSVGQGTSYNGNYSRM